MPEEGATTVATETTQATDTTAQAENTTQTGTLLQSGESTGEVETGTKETAAETQTEKKDEKPAVPEKYEFTAPEGTTLDAAAVEAFTPLAKELGLSNEQAQKLVDFDAKRVSDLTKANLDAWQKQQTDWLTEVKADKEFGGQNLDANLRASNAAFGQFFTKEEVAQIHALGLANFPPLVKGLSRVGKLMAEDKYINGQNQVSGEGNSFLPGSKRI